MISGCSFKLGDMGEACRFSKSLHSSAALIARLYFHIFAGSHLIRGEADNGKALF